MRSELSKLQKELGIGFVHVTDAQDEALALAEEIVVMNDAVIEQVGPAREVFNTPKTRFGAQFMGGHKALVQPESHFTCAAMRSGLRRQRLARAVMEPRPRSFHVSSAFSRCFLLFCMAPRLPSPSGHFTVRAAG